MPDEPDQATISSTVGACGTGSTETRRLFAVLYEQLRTIASRELRRSGSVTLSSTTLLHETYLALAERDDLAFPDHATFLAYAARAMRCLAIDYARTRQAQKRGGQFEITSLPTEVPELAADHRGLEQLSDAIEELAAVDAALAQLVDLKYFCGLTFVEIAAVRGVSERTVQRDWDKARLYLFRALRQQGGGPSPAE